jgi:hypothetical protein
LIAIGRWSGRKLPRTCDTEALLTKPIDFAALRGEIDMRSSAPRSWIARGTCPTLLKWEMSLLGP